MLFCDLDGFKNITLSCSRAGDRVLIEVGQRLSVTARDHDLVAHRRRRVRVMMRGGRFTDARRRLAARCIGAGMILPDSRSASRPASVLPWGVIMTVPRRCVRPTMACMTPNVRAGGSTGACRTSTGTEGEVTAIRVNRQHDELYRPRVRIAHVLALLDDPNTEVETRHRHWR